jgi:hypothetical protein
VLFPTSQKHKNKKQKKGEMKTMKNTKKLIPALGMLLLSACMLVTSTFAWFSMNTSVTATNMSVSAKADQVYLQIINGKSASGFDASAGQTTAKADASCKTLQPSNVVKSFSGKTYEPFAGKDNIVWVSNTSATVDKFTGVQNYEAVTTENVYFLKTNFMIRLNKSAGKDKATAPLTATGVNFSLTDAGVPKVYNDTFANCVSVLVVCKEIGEGNTETITGAQLFKQSSTNGDFSVKSGDTYLNATTVSGVDTPVFANTTGVLIEVYVFFDGENEKCTIAGLNDAQENEAGYSIDVSFSCQ